MEETFTRFPNFILEQLMSFDLSGREFKIVLAVIRKTYGFHKTAEELSLKTLSKLTGINKGDISTVVNSLMEREIIFEIEKPDFFSGRTITLNENVNKWKNKKHTVCKKQTQTVCENTTQTVCKKPTPIYIKENNKRNIKEREPTEKMNYHKPSYDLALFNQMLNAPDD